MGSPVALAVLLLVVLAGGTYVLLGGRQRRDERRDARSRSRGIRVRRRDVSIPSSRARRWQRRGAVVLLIGAVAFLVAAIAQFRLNRQVSQGEAVLVIDASKSMNLADVQPSRLAAAENAARAFANKVPDGFRVGLVTFAGEANVAVPPTTDLNRVIGATTFVSTSAGTHIGDGLTAALNAIQADWQQNGQSPTAIVLLTDGQDTGSTVSPTIAAARAKGLGIRVFTVAVGKPDTGTGGNGANVGLLQQIADTTGATSSTAETAGQLTQVYQSLGSQLSTEVAVSNLGAYFMVAAVVLAVVAGALVLLASRSPY